MNFEQQIQQWVAIDNQMKILGDKMKELRDKKNTISEQINTHIETTELSNASVKINDGQLKFVKVKETQQLTFKYFDQWTCKYDGNCPFNGRTGKSALSACSPFPLC
jgi:hypothetical protein